MYTRIKNILGSFGDRQVSRETAENYYIRLRRRLHRDSLDLCLFL